MDLGYSCSYILVCSCVDSEPFRCYLQLGFLDKIVLARDTERGSWENVLSVNHRLEKMGHGAYNRVRAFERPMIVFEF